MATYEIKNTDGTKGIEIEADDVSIVQGHFQFTSMYNMKPVVALFPTADGRYILRTKEDA